MVCSSSDDEDTTQTCAAADDDPPSQSVKSPAGRGTSNTGPKAVLADYQRHREEQMVKQRREEMEVGIRF